MSVCRSCMGNPTIDCGVCSGVRDELEALEAERDELLTEVKRLHHAFARTVLLLRIPSLTLEEAWEEYWENHSGCKYCALEDYDYMRKDPYDAGPFGPAPSD